MFAIPTGHTGSLLIGRSGPQLRPQLQKATGEKNNIEHTHTSAHKQHTHVPPSLLYFPWDFIKSMVKGLLREKWHGRAQTHVFKRASTTHTDKCFHVHTLQSSQRPACWSAHIDFSNHLLVHFSSLNILFYLFFSPFISSIHFLIIISYNNNYIIIINDLVYRF